MVLKVSLSFDASDWRRRSSSHLFDIPWMSRGWPMRHASHLTLETRRGDTDTTRVLIVTVRDKDNEVESFISIPRHIAEESIPKPRGPHRAEYDELTLRLDHPNKGDVDAARSKLVNELQSKHADGVKAGLRDLWRACVDLDPEINETVAALTSLPPDVARKVAIAALDDWSHGDLFLLVGYAHKIGEEVMAAMLDGLDEMGCGLKPCRAASIAKCHAVSGDYVGSHTNLDAEGWTCIGSSLYHERHCVRTSYLDRFGLTVEDVRLGPGEVPIDIYYNRATV